MSMKFTARAAFSGLALCVTGLGAWYASSFINASDRIEGASQGSEKKDSSAKGPGPASSPEALEPRFASQVRPFVERYCVSCHGSKKPKAGLDLGRDLTVAAIT